MFSIFPPWPQGKNSSKSISCPQLVYAVPSSQLYEVDQRAPIRDHDCYLTQSYTQGSHSIGRPLRHRRKIIFISIIFFYILSGSQEKSKRVEYQKEIHSIKSWFQHATHRKSHQSEKKSDWLIFHRKIEQTIKKAAAKVVHEKLHLRSYIQRTYTMKKLSDNISLREEFRIC